MCVCVFVFIGEIVAHRLSNNDTFAKSGGHISDSIVHNACYRMILNE